MGNIYFEQKKYPQAVKQYRMALDQVPNTHKDMRCIFKIKLLLLNSYKIVMFIVSWSLNRVAKV